MPEIPPPETAHHATAKRPPQGRKKAAAPAPAKGLSNTAFALVFAALMTTAAGGNALVTVMPAIGREIGIGDTLIASVFSLSALFWTVTSPFWAHQSDRRGRKAMMIVGLGGFSLSMLLFGAVVLAGLAQLATPLAILAGMAIARSIYGLIGAAANPAAQAYIADRTSRAQRTGSMALLASAFGLGTIVGPALAPFFVLPGIGLAGPMFAFAAVGGTVTLLIWRLLPAGDFRATAQGRRPTHAAAPKTSIWRDPRVQPFITYGFVMGSAQALNTQVLGFHIIDALGETPAHAQAFIGIAMFAGAAAALIAQWGLIRMLDLGPKELIRYGAMLAAAGNVLLMIAPSYFSVVIGFALLSLGFGFTRPGFTAGASLAVKADEQGTVAGAVAAVNGACWLVSPILGVALYEWRSFAPYLMNLAALLGLVWFAYADRVLKTAGVVAVETPGPNPGAPV
ncbi:MAG: MFS transporter [Caulobacteraceae bacterium]|nr:MFS transporter [Caulobacteraceae bacterium]